MNSSFSIEHAFILLIFLLMSYTISRGLIPIVIKLVHKFDLMDMYQTDHDGDGGVLILLQFLAEREGRKQLDQPPARQEEREAEEGVEHRRDDFGKEDTVEGGHGCLPWVT